MTPSDIDRIRLSFAVVAQDPDGLAAEFYGRLFVLAPSVRPLFTSDRHAQGRKLVGMLAVVVRSLDRLETIMDAIQLLGRRHVAYGVVPAHYEQVGAALLDTIQARLGHAQTPEVRSSWAAAYGVLSAVMIAAAAEAQHA